jgi:hypothetical protein
VNADDQEIIAIRDAYNILRELDSQAAARVIRWLTDRLDADMIKVDIIKADFSEEELSRDLH